MTQSETNTATLQQLLLSLILQHVGERMACWCWMCMKLIAVADKQSQLDSWKESQHYSYLSSTEMDDFNSVVEAKPWSMRLSHLWFFPPTVHNYHRSASSRYTSARIVFCLNLTCYQYSFDAFLETQMWWMCDRNKTRDREHNWRIYFQELCPSSCPYSWNTIYNTCGVWLKTGSLRTSEISSSATTDWSLHRESGLDMKSYFYNSVGTLEWFTVLMEARVSSAALMTKLQIWIIQELQKAKLCWQQSSRIIGYALEMHKYFLKTGKMKILLNFCCLK